MGFRVTDFASLGVWTAVVMDIDEVKTDDSRPRPRIILHLLSEEVVDDDFKFIR